MCVCACVRVCVRACVRACVREYVRARASVRNTCVIVLNFMLFCYFVLKYNNNLTRELLTIIT